MRVLQGVLFLSLALGVPVGIHYYLWARLVRDTALPGPWRAAATAALVLLFASMPLAFFVPRIARESIARLVVWPAFVWMGMMFLLFVLAGATDLVRLAAGAIARIAWASGDAVDPERRVLLARALGGGVAAFASVLGVASVRSALGPVVVRELAVTLKRLPRSLHSTTIVQLTDLHVGPMVGRDFVERIVEQTNALSPDLVAITGDLVDGTVEQLRQIVAPIGRLRARHGVYFVTGNHEYYVSMDGVRGVESWFAELGRLGVRVLRNERVTIGDGDGGFDLAGVDDWSARRLGHPGHGPDLRRALSGRDRSRELVLLAHQPKHIHQAAAAGVGLQLSGHTHGGQIWPFGYLVGIDQPFVAGLGSVGETQIYVSRGTGYWGPPMRLGSPAEITKIVLRAPA